uniref:Uncharacterized protein n=1 Tax=Timema douglasi TaxID=61478 RepID=A0A7R8ZBJ1_TIMDO|nr:unnamed protein product [Timema douglasi]
MKQVYQTGEEETESVTTKEVKDIIKNLKNKAPEPDRIPVEKKLASRSNKMRLYSVHLEGGPSAEFPFAEVTEDKRRTTQESACDAQIRENDGTHSEVIQLHTIGNKKEDGEDSGRASRIIGRNVLNTLQAAKEKLERDVSVPEGVSVAIDELLDAVIRLHIRCKIYSMLNEVALKLLQTLDSQRNSLTGEEQRWPHWVLRRANFSTVQEFKPISFGIVDTIENIEVDTPLISVKDRPPTPVPSLTELVEAIFEDPMLTTEEEIMQDFIHEKTKIKKTLRKMAKHLYRAIIFMPDHILDANKRKFIRRQFSRSSQREDDLDEVVHRLTDAMLSHEDDELMNNEAMQFAIDFLFKDFMQQTYFPESKSREFSKSGREKSKSVTIFPPPDKDKREPRQSLVETVACRRTGRLDIPVSVSYPGNLKDTAMTDSKYCLLDPTKGNLKDTTVTDSRYCLLDPTKGNLKDTTMTDSKYCLLQPTKEQRIVKVSKSIITNFEDDLSDNSCSENTLDDDDGDSMNGVEAFENV